MRVAVALIVLMLAGCSNASSEFVKQSLSPGDNPFRADNELWAPQPKRDNPLSLLLSPDGTKLYVTLQGDEDSPGDQVAVIDTLTETRISRIQVGTGPTRIRLHPGGRFAAVTNLYSNYVSIIDLHNDQVATSIAVPFYTVDIAFTPDGQRAFLSNRWKDSVLRWNLDVEQSFNVTDDNYSMEPADAAMGISVGTNPRDLAISPDGTHLYVASPTATTLSIIDLETEEELRRVELMSPPAGLAVTNDYVFYTHTGRGTHHPPNLGFDTNGNGKPGDSTANVMFQDLQNEIGVLDRDGDLVHNYGSDSMCCYDYRDVDPDNPTKGEGLAELDAWPAERVDFLPPKETWIVACALPEQVVMSGKRLFVVCSASNEVQGFDVADDGSLSPRQTGDGLYKTGMNPFGMVVSKDHTHGYVSERLGEYITVLDLTEGPGAERRILAGMVEGGEYPATDAEIGEALNFVTAPLTIDGDMSCAHCHREGGNIAKPLAMPLQADTTWGTRMQMAYRGAADTKPWFMESAMDENNFFPVLNEFGRKENFCCEQMDPTIWTHYPSLSECSANDELDGCNHVLHCKEDPPPECAARNYGSQYATRSEHFLAGAQSLLGQDRSFGDALFEEIIGEDGSLSRRGIRLDFSGVSKAIGLFLLTEPRLPPNPNAPLEMPAAARGKILYESLATGCASCHPLPTTTVSVDFNPSSVPLLFPALITPRLVPETGENADLVNPLFMGAFPLTVQDEAGVYFGVPQLRGIWDRADRFYHDGRARNLREALATPDHPALHAGETGYNETYGMPDTHGATSHLSPQDLEDLISFLLTL